jgi:hypothetical protein
MGKWKYLQRLKNHDQYGGIVFIVTHSGCKLAVGWKQQPIIPGPLGPQPFVCCLLVILPLILSI